MMMIIGQFETLFHLALENVRSVDTYGSSKFRVEWNVITMKQTLRVHSIHKKQCEMLMNKQANKQTKQDIDKVTIQLGNQVHTASKILHLT
jgi:hypothetical protein